MQPLFWRHRFEGVYVPGAKQDYRITRLFNGRVKVRAKKAE